MFNSPRPPKSDNTKENERKCKKRGLVLLTSALAASCKTGAAAGATASPFAEAVAASVAAAGAAGGGGAEGSRQRGRLASCFDCAAARLDLI